VREGADGELVGGGGRQQSRGKAPVPGMSSQSASVGKHAKELAGLPRAEDLSFELAARLRDEVNELKKELRGMDAAGVR